jgi:hypothetical protein
MVAGRSTARTLVASRETAVFSTAKNPRVA